MSVSKVQFTRALSVIPSTDANIPSPYAIVSGTTTDAVGNQLIDSNVNFTELNVQTGDIVYNTTSSQAATVVSVIDNYTLELNADAAPLGENYTIYQASPQTGLGNQGCCLLTSESASIEVVTIGGDSLTIYSSRGIVVPIQVLKVTSVSAGSVVALW